MTSHPHNNCGASTTLKYISSASIRNLFQWFNDTRNVTTLAEIKTSFHSIIRTKTLRKKIIGIQFHLKKKKAITCRRPTFKNVPLQPQSGTFALVQCQHFIYPHKPCSYTASHGTAIKTSQEIAAYQRFLFFCIQWHKKLPKKISWNTDNKPASDSART